MFDRILLFGTALAPGLDNGGRTFIEGLARALAAQGVHVGMVASPEAVAGSSQLLDAVEILPCRQVSGFKRVAADFYRAERLSRSFGSDCVCYPHEWAPPVTAPLIQVVQNIGWVHPWSRREYGLRGRMLKALALSTARWSSGRVHVSPLAFGLWKQAGLPTDSTDVVLPEAVDAIGEMAVAKRGPGADVLVVTGRAAHKLPHFSVECAEEIVRQRSDLSVLVVGLPEPAEVKHSLGVSYAPYLPRTEMLGLMKDAAVVLHLSQVESFGLPTVEALNCGTRVVVLSGTPMAELGAGSVNVAPWSVTSVAAIALDVLGEGSVVATMPSGLTWDVAGPRWFDYFAKVVELNP